MNTPTEIDKFLTGFKLLEVDIDISAKLYRFIWEKGLENLDILPEKNYLGWIKKKTLDEYFRKLVEKHYMELNQNGRRNQTTGK